MWPFKKHSLEDHRKNTKEVQLKLSGMHCTSCALNIDGELEDLPGIISSATSYAQSQIKIIFDAQQCSLPKILKVITDLGYTVEEKK